MNSLKLTNVDKSFFHNGERIFEIKSVNISIKKGSVVSILGESGCGKTTILRLIADIINPDNGEIIFEKNQFARQGRRV